MVERSADLPEPDSDVLHALLRTRTHRLLYDILYRRRMDNPPTMVEMQAYVANELGEDRSQTDRRARELRRHFHVRVEQDAQGAFRYQLMGRKPEPLASEQAISQRIRAQVLQPQRCAQCGRTPLEDLVKLVVDHKIPQSWSGTNDLENLQPLCEDCNAGKRDYFRSFEARADEIQQAIEHDEPQRRIGELLKAFAGAWVPSDLLGIVASAKDYQEDWQRRLRDLRFLGWVIEHRNRHDEGARVRAYYRLVKSAPWPDNISAAIRAEEERRRQAKRGASASPG